MSTHPFKLRNTEIKRQPLQNGDDATLSKYIGQNQRLQKLQLFFPTATTALCIYAGPNISTNASNKKVSERNSKPTFLLRQFLFLHNLTIDIIIIIIVIIIIIIIVIIIIIIVLVVVV